MIVIDAGGVHPFIGAKPPFATDYAMGDIDELVFADKYKSVFLSVPTQLETGKKSFLAVRILLDNDLLKVPRTGGILDVADYFRCLPTRAAVYAMRNGKLLNYSLDDFRRDWNRFFKKNSMYRHLAAKRYKSSRQALIEFHSCTDRGNRFFQKLTIAIFGRITAFTEECAARVLFGAAVVLEFPKFFKHGIPLCRF